MNKIEIQLPCEAFVTTAYFVSQGMITGFNENSKYVEWEIEGIKQPIVNINCVGFILK